MKKGRYLLRWAGILTVSIITLYGTCIYGLSQVLKVSSHTRADVIKIDKLTVFGELEKPPVEFLHEVHTEALARKNKDCATCHLIENDRIFPKFKRIADKDRIEVMNVYHNGCISCHGEMRVDQEKAGPVKCDGCHREKIQYTSSRQPMGFDKSLHFRHSESQGNKCDPCHHEYDETAKKLFYAKQKEGTCRYCHRHETKENRMSMRQASHIACIDCHRKNLSKNLTAGPITCSGCHEAAAREAIKKVSAVPRMDRKQPDVVLLKADSKGTDPDAGSTNQMNFVPFDHKAHEDYNNTCRVCHHETLKPCNECHSLAGKKEGGEVNLEKAMHQASSEKSCQGCHVAKQTDKRCAGCHVSMGKKERKKEEALCIQCHSAQVNPQEMPSDPDKEKSPVEGMLRFRNSVSGTYPEKDIPEKVVIKTLSNQFEAVDFPHRRIVHALVGNIKDSKLARYFHQQEGTVCQGCHHNAPVSMKPSNCENCHGKSFDAKNPLIPGIIAAYHLQCMGCHKEMGIEKPAACADCHKSRE
jgi:hypothetical protein